MICKVLPRNNVPFEDVSREDIPREDVPPEDVQPDLPRGFHSSLGFSSLRRRSLVARLLRLPARCGPLVSRRCLSRGERGCVLLLSLCQAPFHIGISFGNPVVLRVQLTNRGYLPRGKRGDLPLLPLG